jgi:hypothetical protein
MYRNCLSIWKPSESFLCHLSSSSRLQRGNSDVSLWPRVSIATCKANAWCNNVNFGENAAPFVSPSRHFGPGAVKGVLGLTCCSDGPYSARCSVGKNAEVFSLTGRGFVVVSTEPVMKNGVFWDVTSRGSSKNRRFRGAYRLHHQGDKNRRTRNNVSRNWQSTQHASVASYS